MYFKILIPSLIFAVCGTCSCNPKEYTKHVTTKSSINNGYQRAIEAIQAVTIRLEALTMNNTHAQNKNFLVSPLSAVMIIGQLMLASDGKFRDDLHQLLTIPNKNTTSNFRRALPKADHYEELHHQLKDLTKILKTVSKNSDAFTIEPSNAIFYNSPIRLKDTFKKDVNFYYGTEAVPVNFTGDPIASQEAINNWSSNHTNGLIKIILQEPAPPTTTSIFANAIYFKGNWKTPFSNELNINDTFHITNNVKADAQFMRGLLEDIPYVESKKYNCKMLSLPYEEDDIRLYIILPNKNHEFAYNITQFSQQLETSDIEEMISSMKNEEVIIKIPKMSLRSTMSILEPLKKYSSYIKSKKNRRAKSVVDRIINWYRTLRNDGIKEVKENVREFVKYETPVGNDDIILSNAAEGENLKLSNLYQEMTFSINEKGTEAATVTAGIIDYIASSKTFVVDRPFIFFIRHENTTATIFWGTIVDPTLQS